MRKSFNVWKIINYVDYVWKLNPMLSVSLAEHIAPHCIGIVEEVYRCEILSVSICFWVITIPDHQFCREGSYVGWCWFESLAIIATYDQLWPPSLTQVEVMEKCFNFLPTFNILLFCKLLCVHFEFAFLDEAQYGNQALILPNLSHHVWHHLTHQSDYKLGNLNNSQSWEQPRRWVLSIFLLWKVILEPWDLVISKRFKEAAVPSVLRVSKCVKNIIKCQVSQEKCHKCQV